MGIERNGWTCTEDADYDSDGFWRPNWTARRGTEERMLPVSSFAFDMTAQRFAYLVDHDFPSPPGIGPWCNADLDKAIADEAWEMGQ